MDRLDTLAVFVEVAEQGSFVKAAKRLGRSQAAISRAVASLEARLDTALFLRTTRAVTLTDAGARYLERCRHLLAGFEELEAAAASEQAEPQGLVSITVPVVFGRLHVLPVVAEFLKDYPAVQMRVLMHDRNVALVEEGIDLGVRLGPLADSTLRAIKVGHVTRGIYASPDYLARAGTPLVPADLRHHECIAITSIAPTDESWSFGRRNARQTVRVTPRITVTTIDAGVEVAIMGQGLARLHSYQADRHVSEGRLVPVLADYAPEEVPIHVIHPASAHVAVKTRTFIDRLVPALRAKFL